MAVKKKRKARCPQSSDQSTRWVAAVAIELNSLLSAAGWPTGEMASQPVISNWQARESLMVL
jgi:hypothetical protein